MSTLKILKEQSNPVYIQNVIGLLGESEEALALWLNVIHLNKTFNLHADTNVINTETEQAVNEVVGYRKMLGLCSYGQELRADGKRARDLPTALN